MSAWPGRDGRPPPARGMGALTPWQHRGNIHRVSNRPDRPRNPAPADDLDTTDTTSAPPARLRALWGVSPVGVRVSLGALKTLLIGDFFTVTRASARGFANFLATLDRYARARVSPRDGQGDSRLRGLSAPNRSRRDPCGARNGGRHPRPAGPTDPRAGHYPLIPPAHGAPVVSLCGRRCARAKCSPDGLCARCRAETSAGGASCSSRRDGASAYASRALRGPRP